jgi:hypothetical protein
MHWISASCGGEKCGMCWRAGNSTPATHKVGEEIPHDDPNQMRHNFTQYVCCEHFKQIFGGHAAPCAAREEVMGKAESELEIVGKPQGITGAATPNAAAQQNAHAQGFDVDHLFTYHPPTPDQLERYESIRAAARVFAHVILLNTKPSADQAAAIRLLRECVMTGNASIALEK